MKKIALTLALILFTITIAMNMSAPLTATAAMLSEDFQFNGDFAYYSKYVYEGFTWDEDPVLQAGLYFDFKGLNLSLWNSQDTRNEEGDNSDEVDYVVGYTYTLNKLSFGLKHTYFDCPGTNSFAKEYSVEFSYDTFLSPSIVWQYDYLDDSYDGDITGNYVTLWLSHSYPVGKEVSLDLSGHVGYNDSFYIEGTGSDVGLTLAMSLGVSDKLVYTPSISYSMPFGDLSDENDGDQENTIYAGIIIEY